LSISCGRIGTFFAAIIYPRIYHSTEVLYYPFVLSLFVVFLGFIVSIIIYFTNEKGAEGDINVSIF